MVVRKRTVRLLSLLQGSLFPPNIAHAALSGRSLSKPRRYRV
jgi:hypothetical protein